MALVTLTQRKEREAARRKTEASRIMRALAVYARENGGRYLVFGTTARDQMTYRSDFDVLVDFPVEKEFDAFAYVEDLGLEGRLPVDALSLRTMSERFMRRNEPDMIVLP